MELKRVVLIGAGHAHLYVAHHARTFRSQRAEVVLIDPGSFWYSGLATGVLAGQYPCEADRIDPEPLITQSGGSFIRSAVKAIAPEERTLRLADGGTLEWDVLSLNIGSVVTTAGIRGAEHAVAVKPIHRLCDLRNRLEHDERVPGQTLHLAVVGAGATGCEIALSLDGLAQHHGWARRVTLIARDGVVLGEFPRRAQAWLRRRLATRGVEIVAGTAASIDPGRVVLDDGSSVRADIAVLATGLRAPHLTRAIGLPASTEGLHVNEFLQSPAHPNVFAAGDCAHFLPCSLPKLGVFGVRQAPVLLHNIHAALAGAAPKAYRPQSRYLTILNLGDDTALARWGQWWVGGRTMMRLKSWLDQRFLARHRL